MKQIVLTKAVWVDGNLYNDFIEGAREVTWLSEKDKGVQVRFDSGSLALIPWSNITIVFDL